MIISTLDSGGPPYHPKCKSVLESGVTKYLELESVCADFGCLLKINNNQVVISVAVSIVEPGWAIKFDQTALETIPMEFLINWIIKREEDAECLA